jgi:hypothetical protein
MKLWEEFDITEEQVKSLRLYELAPLSSNPETYSRGQVQFIRFVED